MKRFAQWNKAPLVRRELHALDNALHDLIVELRREGSEENARKLLRIKNYVIRTFVAMSDDAVGKAGTPV